MRSPSVSTGERQQPSKSHSHALHGNEVGEAGEAGREAIAIISTCG
ncbi:hypothetical protein [Iningainema tapete]|uniref:Uncharacterized protein n=1 Tax=Iningainema tapete BLCC-T55 TaxID=2748662 RepID=A0A8J7BY40_9CYAN|nr:hypothetical protein [Iningainema tapete]MBD2774977.1 hypothetical protein [Iningainema tapete BLCC-T55]